MRYKLNNIGFTILEIALVIGAAGLILAAIGQGYRIYLVGQEVRDANVRLQNIQKAIGFFAADKGRYPCPADPALPETDPQAGVENCGATGATIRVAGAVRDVNNSGDPPDATDAGIITSTPGLISDVLIGSVPYVTLSPYLPKVNDYSLEASFATTGTFVDPWRRRFMYAVTEKMTVSGQDELFGAISVETEAGNSLVKPNGTATFVLFSAGENGTGAYNQNGQLFAPCPAGTPGSTVAQDAANCQQKPLFVSGLRNLETSLNNYFDDIVYFTPMQKQQALWNTVPLPTEAWVASKGYSPGDLTLVTDAGGATFYYQAKSAHTSDATTQPGIGADWQTVWTFLPVQPPQVKIYNANLTGNVGLGTNNPATKLDIRNSGPSGALQTNTVISAQICDQDGTHCFSPNILGGLATPLACPSGQLMTGIANGAAVCAPRPNVASVIGVCPFPGQLAYGISATGQPLCRCAYSDPCTKCPGDPAFSCP